MDLTLVFRVPCTVLFDCCFSAFVLFQVIIQHCRNFAGLLRDVNVITAFDLKSKSGYIPPLQSYRAITTTPCCYTGNSLFANSRHIATAEIHTLLQLLSGPQSRISVVIRRLWWLAELERVAVPRLGDNYSGFTVIHFSFLALCAECESVRNTISVLWFSH